jgi:hypothetical protein
MSEAVESNGKLMRNGHLILVGAIGEDGMASNEDEKSIEGVRRDVQVQTEAIWVIEFVAV